LQFALAGNAEDAMDEREAVNRAVAEHLEQLRRRLAEGRTEIDRQRAEVGATQEHMAEIGRWIEQTDVQLDLDRERRKAGA
jgi:ribosome-interacting GTPase 1